MDEEYRHPRGSGYVYAPASGVRWRASAGAASPPDDDAIASDRWGIGLSPWLWAPTIRILFVTDGVRIGQGFGKNGAEGFGLGSAIATLRDRWFQWWARFSVTFKDRYEGFRFTQDGFNLNDFDQVWLFGDSPGEDVANDPSVGDDIIESSPEYTPLTEAELRLLAQWMERGGGMFATGDHSLLGASMCWRIPRVRNMRKWTHAQGVPPFEGPGRHETLVHNPQTYDLAWEGDRWPQPIFPVYQHDPQAVGPGFEHKYPHPLLCGRDGIIDRFPDHMHEGCVIEDQDVRLLDPLGIAGYEREEFPVDAFGVRTRPHVIAHGLTTNQDAPPRRFGLIGVYDGDPVGIGRVVVDSTWHHWFNMNLRAFPTEAATVFSGMQDYYRNVAIWLSTPEQRASMLFAATWGGLVGTQPEAFHKVLGIWGLGQRVLDVIGRTAPQCIVSDMVTAFLKTRGSPVLTASSTSQKQRPARFLPPISMKNQAIVGGIAMELVELAHNYMSKQARPRSGIDADAIRQKALQGVTAGVNELIASLSESSSQLATLRDTIKRRELGHIPISCEPIDEAPATSG